MAAEYGDLRGPLEKMIQLLKSIEKHTGCTSCGGNGPTTIAGTNSNVPAGLRSVAIVKTSAFDTVTITMSDTSSYDMTVQNEVFTDSSGGGGGLPEYVIVGPGTWKWHGIK